MPVDRHLRGDDFLIVGLERDELHITRLRRVRYIENAPTLVEGMAHIEIPAAIGGAVERHLESAVMPAQGGKADRFHMLGLPARRNRIGEAAGRERGCENES